MNICLISQEYPPETNWGGIATYTQVLARQLVKIGQRVHVITLAEGAEYITDDLGVTVHRVSRTPKEPFDPAAMDDLDGLNHCLLYFSQRVYEEIRDIHEKEPIDVIEAPETCAQGLLTFKRLKGVRTVTRCHTPFFWVRQLNAMEDNADHLVRDTLERMQTHCSTAVTSPTNAMAQVVHDKWGTEDIQVIPNFFNLNAHQPDLSVYQQHLAGTQYLLFFGRLEYRKGVHILAQALPIILKADTSLKAVFAGSDSVYNSMSMKSYIKNQVKGYEDRTIFIENLPHQALYPLIARAQFVVLPSLWENFPYACLEAMSLGKAIVASDSGGFPEIIASGKEGILCKPGEVEALTQAMLECMRADRDELGKNAGTKAQTYDTELVVGKMMIFYQSMENGNPASAPEKKHSIGYILSRFPLPSETFVINEIIALQYLGFDIQPIAMYGSEPCQEGLMSKVWRETYDLSKLARQQIAQTSEYMGEAKRLAAQYELSPWYAEFAACVADHVTANKLEMLHAHFAADAALVAMLVAELTGIPFSFTAHAYDLFIENIGAPGETRDKRLKILTEKAAQVIVISEYNKRFLLQKTGGNFDYKIKVVHCGIDPQRFTPVARGASDSFTALCVGRFVEKKGHEYLLKAFQKVADKLPKATLKLVGDGPLQPAMLELCKGIGLEARVHFLGNISSEKVCAEIGTADVFVLHSITAANGDSEGIPVSLMEASACGLPVVSTRHSGIPELVVDNSTGLLTEERDINSLADCLIELASNGELRDRLGKEGVRLVSESFNLHKEAGHLAKIFRSTLSEDAGLPDENDEVDKKSSHEMIYWQERKRIEETLDNSHYKYFYTQYFGLSDGFYQNKAILDIGCGPRGSLEWANMTSRRIGLDPLADAYKVLGTSSQNMEYVASGSEDIPFPDDYFDVVTSFNSLDHVKDLGKSISEIKRVLRPGGTFLLITDVNHQPTICEPISFSWDIVDRFTDELDCDVVVHLEKSADGVYDSIKNNIPYNIQDGTQRYGVLTARFVKKGVSAEGADDTPMAGEYAAQLPFISIIIPVFNGEETLDLCLESVAKLRYPLDLLEVLVVDNGSTDASVAIAQKYQVTVLHEDCIKSSYAARNVGIKAAKGELIAFTDADCIVTPNWIEYLVAHWSDQTIGCFAGEIEAYQPEDLIEIFSDRAGILRQNGTLTCSYLPYTQTANSSYRKTVFDQVGLFNPEMTSGGDADIAWRMQKELGLGIKFIPEALVYHKHRTSLQGLYTQFKKYEYGKVSWINSFPDYQLPSIDQRKEALVTSIEQIRSNIYRDVNNFCQDKTDLAEVMTTFFNMIISLGTYKARLEIGQAPHISLDTPAAFTLHSTGPTSSENNLGIKQKLEYLESLLVEKDNTLKECQLQLQSSKLRTQELLESLSWRITAPLRKIFDMLFYNRK